MHVETFTRRLWTAWDNVHHAARRVLRSHRTRAIRPVLAILLTVSPAAYEYYLASSDQAPETYRVLALDKYERLLVLAPHCDDEVLGAGGLIQAALRQGLDVHVIIATAGDGYRRATMAELHRAFPRPEDFISMGELRQQESMDALTRLGLDASAVTFLAYPERGLSALWWDHWESAQPYRSPYSKREQSLYPHAFNPAAWYSGEALLDSLRTILAIDRPDLIVMPHPNDAHPDHRMLSMFVTLSVEMERAKDPTFQPQMLGYLVHHGLYPQPFGLRPGESLRPPRQLAAVGEWLQWQLSIDELMTKREALEAYHSQQRVLGYFLNSFVRRNELYMEVDETIALGVVEGETFLDLESALTVLDDTNLPGRNDPVSDSVLRRLSSRADIAGLHVLRLGDSVWVALDLRGCASHAYSYDLFVRAFTPDATTTWSAHYGRISTDRVLAHGHSIWYRLDLDTLGQPDWLTLAGETRQGVVLDRTAWYLVRLEEGPLDELVSLPIWRIIAPDG